MYRFDCIATPGNAVIVYRRFCFKLRIRAAGTGRCVEECVWLFSIAVGFILGSSLPSSP